MLRIRARLLLALILVAAAGCDERSGNSPSASSAPTQTKREIKVVLIHPGRENDRGWNQLAFESLMEVGKHDGVQVKHLYAPNRSNDKADIRALVEQNFDLVICHGSEFIKTAREMAPQFPKTHFVVTGIDEAGDGVATLDFRLWEATYLCGMLAAFMVPEGPAGLIGGEDFRTVRYTLDAFTTGARTIVPGYRTHVQYVGSWDDVARAAQTAQSLLDGYKVRLIFQNTDAAAFGVFQAIEESGTSADGKPCYAFGCNSDQNNVAPDHVLASAVIDMSTAFEQLIDQVRDNKFEGRVIVHDLASGGVKFVPNPRLMVQWPKGLEQRLNDARDDIIAGQLDVLLPR